MKYLYTLILFSITIVAKPCGWGPEEDDFFYYNLFFQTNISSEAYYPFLRIDEQAFYSPDQEAYMQVKGNIDLWKDVLHTWRDEDIYTILVSENEEEVENLWKGKNSPMDQACKRYLTFARQCSDAFRYRKAYSWDYDEIRKRTADLDVTDLLSGGNNYFNAEKNIQLKMRYGYQIIRILHYTRQYREAIDFFEKHIQDLNKDEIYYYMLDQVAGCYFSLEDYEKAAYLFLTVFNKSYDRKISAFTSYRFCTDRGSEGKSNFSSKDDKCAYFLLRSLRDFSGDTGLEEVFTLDPSSEKAELMFIRKFNDLERNLLPKHIGMASDQLPSYARMDVSAVTSLYDFAERAWSHPEVKNKDFWKLAQAHLLFLQNDFAQAKKELSKITDPVFIGQKQNLEYVFEIFSWDKMNAVREEYAAKLLDEVFKSESVDEWDYSYPAWKYIILDQIGHLYYRDNQLAQAFLSHNKIAYVERIGSLRLLDDLLAFVRKADKNPFEELLMKRTGNVKESSAEDYLLFIKGHYYLQQGRPDLALEYLDQSPLDLNNGSMDAIGITGLVPAKIFSNNIKECFNCDDGEVMVDSVFLASVFNFIPSSMKRSELAKSLTKLDSLTRDSKQWKRKVAHYLLGNYYFNVSNTGYYRGVLRGAGNCCSYNYFPYNHTTLKDAEERIRVGEGYNLFSIKNLEKTYYSHTDRARQHYEQVIANSTDKELNARCLYMLAKCELNSFYNSEEKYGRYTFYDGSMEGSAANYKENFKKLRTEYSDTRFYKMIIGECGFFRYYCSM